MVDKIIIFFDLETTGLDTSQCDIIQLAAVCEERVFNKYTVPQQNIDEGATEVTGFTVQSGHLVLYVSPVETVPIDDLLTSFIDFLRSFQRPVLLAAHNAKRFDMPVLTRVMKKYDLYPQFQQVVSGFLDTLLLSKRLFPRIKGYSQVSLVKIFLQKSYDAHNAEEDAKMLQELYKVWRPDQFAVLASTSEVN
ncbi:DNA polymerase III PolC-type-like isoform X2 [Poecilia reticulata]|uniref:DNA polymerase III PolC-type-like isoform X2 n=1 Tax=Poecilia reticulata TaxID=8081 RepID=UPI0007E9AF00|nr:PREDICTED: DNA polymerase III PolC-type-like isoform X2 [Poecilia reticulata]